MSFRNIKGQEKAVSALQALIKAERFEGGYLFSGPQGVGKKLAAVTLAKVLNCEEKELDSCDKCASCRKIDAKQHPDIHIIEPEDSEIKIADIRQLQREISFKAYEARKKVFIIDNAHKLNAESSNALLKVLEEPTKETVIILITDKPFLLFKTVISRCKVLKFLAASRQELKEIIKRELSLDNITAHYLAYFSEGRLGRALRINDARLLNEKNKVIDKFVFSRKSELDTAAQKKEDLKEEFNILATWFRDLYILKVGMPHSELINFDRKDELLKLMNRYTFSELNEIIDSISTSIRYLEQNINIKLLMHNLGVQLWKG